MKNLVFKVFIVVFLVFLFFINFSAQFSRNNSLEIYFFDVGQGDSALVKTPENKFILIDGGPDNKILYKLGKVIPFYKNSIDYVILTHPHADHLNGLIAVLKKYKVGKVILTGVLHTSPNYIQFLKLLKNQNVVVIKQKQVFQIEKDLRLEFLWPEQNLYSKRVKSLNDSSIVFRLVYKNKAVLFTGDISREVESKIIQQKINAIILKIAHHGSSSSSSKIFLQKVKPRFAIISVGINNPFHHPSLRILKRLERLNIKILRTDKYGDIHFVFKDGEFILK